MINNCIQRLFVHHSVVEATSLLPHFISKRYCLGTAQKPSAYRLSEKAVIQVVGRQSIDLLQGLVTNDISKLDSSEMATSAQYSMMLNAQGRVMYDLIIYRSKNINGNASFFMECHSDIKDDFVNSLKRYRIRKQVDIIDVTDCYTVWFASSYFDPSKALHSNIENGGMLNTVLPANVSDYVFCVLDPRVAAFGKRIICRSENCRSLHHVDVETSDAKDEPYRLLRYKWGIPEGPIDLPPGTCLPLESNLTIMHGASFTKGCYVGQELTARTFHSGTIRKRLLPLLFERMKQHNFDRRFIIL